MEYQDERERLAVLAGHAQLAQPGAGASAARAVVQALTATGEAFEYAMARIDEVRPELAVSLPGWYAAARAIGAECVIVAQWWTEELAREPLRWTSEHDARLAEDVEHFEQLRARALAELAEPEPAAAVFASVAMPDLEPWEENLPPRQRRWILAAWPVAAAALLGVGVFAFHAFESGHTTMSGVFNGNTGPAGASAIPVSTGSPTASTPSRSASPTAPRTTAANTDSMAPAAATTAQPSTPATTAQAAVGSTPGVVITVTTADATPRVTATFTVTTSSTAPTTLYTTSYGMTSSGQRTAENFSGHTLSGHTTYTYTETVDTSAWCGDTVIIEATAAGQSRDVETGAGC